MEPVANEPYGKVGLISIRMMMWRVCLQPWRISTNLLLLHNNKKSLRSDKPGLVTQMAHTLAFHPAYGLDYTERQVSPDIDYFYL